MFYVVNFSPNFDVKSVIFPNFGQGPFPKIAGKSPALSRNQNISDIDPVKNKQSTKPIFNTDMSLFTVYGIELLNSQLTIYCSRSTKSTLSPSTASLQ